MSGDVDCRWTVGVIIPARNEEATIEECLNSILTALRATPGVRDTWTVVVCDSCTDGTAPKARRILGSAGEIIECEARSAGSARRIGADAIARHFLHVPACELWLANTDADTSVSPDWITQQLAYARNGWAAIAGIVRLDTGEGADARVADVFREYQLNADGTHCHVHGANIGVRSDAYVSAGGWGDKPLAEDHCLWGRLGERRWPRLATAAVVVTTSGRLVGRAIGGFADTLRAQVALRFA